jgi:hypothetical protein
LAGGNYYGILDGILELFTPYGYWETFPVQIDGEDVLASLYAENAECQFLAEHDRIARSHNGGQSWYWLYPFGDPQLFISELDAMGDTLWAIKSAGLMDRTRLYISLDNGTSWQEADMGIPRDQFHTGARKVIGVGDFLVCCTMGTTTGVYYTPRDHIDWKEFNEGLPWLEVKDIVCDGDYLYASVNSNSVWKRSVQDLKLTHIQRPLTETSQGLIIYPNPAHHAVHITLPMQWDGEMILKVADLAGVIVFQTVISEKTPSIDVAHFQNGLYAVEIATADLYFTTKLVVQH